MGDIYAQLIAHHNSAGYTLSASIKIKGGSKECGGKSVSAQECGYIYPNINFQVLYILYPTFCMHMHVYAS